MRSGRLLAMALTLIAPALMAWAPDADAQDLSRYHEFRLGRMLDRLRNEATATREQQEKARRANIGTFRRVGAGEPPPCRNRVSYSRRSIP